MKHFLISLFLLFPLCAISQVQQGYVKTRGRLGSNGVVIPGKGIDSQRYGREYFVLELKNIFRFI